MIILKDFVMSLNSSYTNKSGNSSRKRRTSLKIQSISHGKSVGFLARWVSFKNSRVSFKKNVELSIQPSDTVLKN